MKQWLSIAGEKSVVLRGLKYAVIVGAILIFINHGDNIIEGTVTAVNVVKMAVTVAVPYLVSTFSSVSAIRELR
ncbi:MAG: nitrate/nitrite transporter NrtS [Candidatus Dadabacteria bacterium]|nr:nitrate/nitrite transporter NrtS [Candidatus Dadabacteria bacterium]